MQHLEPRYTMVKESTLDLGNKIIAGSCYKTIKISKSEQVSFILPKQLIAMQRLNDGYASSKYLIYIFRTGDQDDLVLKTTISGVIPKIDLLCWCCGANRVKKVLKLLDEIKSQGLEFKDLSNEYWIHQHARIRTGRQLIVP